jgi:Tfp pilus assembly protein PilX
MAIIVIFVLTIFGLALMFTTTTEIQIAGAETTVNKAFYAADSGVQVGIANAKTDTTIGPCTQVGFSDYWCFQVPSHDTATASSRTLNVYVTPLRQVDLTQETANQINVGSTVIMDIGYRFDSTSIDSVLNSKKQIEVDMTVGPVPYSLPAK